MHSQYIELLETVILQENINAIVTDANLLKTIGSEIIHNTKLHPYIKNGIETLSNITKEDFESKEMQKVIVALKPHVKIEAREKISSFMVKIATVIGNKLLENKEIQAKIAQIAQDQGANLSDTIIKIVFALIVINDGSISKTARDFMARPSDVSASKDLPSDQYVTGMLSQTV